MARDWNIDPHEPLRLMQITRAQAEHAAKLTEIALAAKRHWGYPERWIEAWRGALVIEPEFIATNETHVAMVEERAVGFYSLTRVGAKLRLEHLWVLPDAMRRGVGRALLEHASERGRSLGCEQMEIESDPNAAGFYERMGAQPVRTEVNEVDGQRRELPVFVLQIKPNDMDRASC